MSKKECSDFNPKVTQISQTADGSVFKWVDTNFFKLKIVLGRKNAE
jgi:hypothetical protein